MPGPRAVPAPRLPDDGQGGRWCVEGAGGPGEPPASQSFEVDDEPPDVEEDDDESLFDVEDDVLSDDDELELSVDDEDDESLAAFSRLRLRVP